MRGWGRFGICWVLITYGFANMGRPGLVAMAAAGAVVAAGAAFFWLPAARIEVAPALRGANVEQTIILSSKAEEPDFQKFILPAQVVEAEAEVRQTVTREGGQGRAAKARGAVRLVNEQAQEQALLPQSHLRHEERGVFFLTDRAVRIPAQGEVEVSVTAKEEGAGGNVPAGRFIIDKLPAHLQQTVYAESAADFSGGEVLDTPLTETELNEMLEGVVGQARERARGELTSKAGGAAIREGLTAEAVEEKEASAPPGSRAVTYIVRARVRLRAFVADDTALLSLTLLALQAHPKPDEEFVFYDPESFTVEIERADFERGEARVTGHIAGSFAQKTEAKIFDTQALAGRTAREVEEYMLRFDSVEAVTVKLWPFWVTSIPSREGAVIVELRKR